MVPKRAVIAIFSILAASRAGAAPAMDLFSDTWVATDALGRSLPTAREAGPPRADRTVGLFYFLWLGAHVKGGPYDITRILAADPAAMRKPDSPLWGPLHAPHHWGESIFGYYRIRDESVLRKHAQMLADAGVDAVFFDVSNQVTYREDYLTLLKVWSEARAAGNRTPQVAFLTPFWDPPKVVRELWRDLYRPRLYPDLWFRWDQRPLILADPDLLHARIEFPKQDAATELRPGPDRTLGQSFTADRPFHAVGGRFPTWRTTNAAVTLTLYRGEPGGERLAARRFENVGDNMWLTLNLTSAEPAGRYYLEAADTKGRIGWWSDTRDSQPDGQAWENGMPTKGDRTLRLILLDPETDALRQFFTFRKPQPDYFQGPTQANMWSWLEVYPQHVFRNTRGEKEQMSVGVAQNAVGHRLGSMSEREAFGRSRHGGTTDTRPQAVDFGLNFAEQADRALREDPRVVFITGWNEWIAGRFREFNGIREPVMFVDQFDQEHSRDIEPMRGGHGDNYYWQMIAFVRRYKGVRPIEPVRPGRIRIDGQFEDWERVGPEYRDTAGDPVRRNAAGWDPGITYRNETGRNDILAAKVSFDAREVAFLARTGAALTPPLGTNWMLLLLDLDGNATNGWLGYDVIVNRAAPASLETHVGPGFTWRHNGAVPWKSAGEQLELAIRWEEVGLTGPPAALDFKWADNSILTGDWAELTLNGDVAPNDRFNYRAVLR